MKQNLMLLLLFTSCSLLSCQKKENRQLDQSNLKITIGKPAEASIFRLGDTVFIQAIVANNIPLHGYSLTIRDKSTQELYLDVNNHIHDSSFQLNTFWVNSLNKKAEMALKLSVIADHDGNEETKEVNFQLE